jgi:hypothetical protein
MAYQNTVPTINVLGAITGTAPAAGHIGEYISSAVTAVSLPNTNPLTITSISLTAGIWNIDCILHGSFPAVVLTFEMGPSTVTNTLQGNLGDQIAIFDLELGASGYDLTLVVPSFRVNLSTTTVYYLVARCDVTSSGTVDGRICATRVG